MNLNEYQNETARTDSTKSSVATRPMFMRLIQDGIEETGTMLTKTEISDIAQSVYDKLSWTIELVITALGLCGEVGELADHVKKHIAHGHTINLDAVEKELGDVLWYISKGARTIGVTLEHCASQNIQKLRTRYPNGFEVERSLNREEERKV